LSRCHKQPGSGWVSWTSIRGARLIWP